MPANALLQFVMALAHDPTAAAAFADHPEQAIADADLHGVSVADIESLLPMATGSAPPPGAAAAPATDIWAGSGVAHAFDALDDLSMPITPHDPDALHTDGSDAVHTDGSSIPFGTAPPFGAAPPVGATPPVGADPPVGDDPGTPPFDPPGFDRPAFDHPGFDQPAFDQPGFDHAVPDQPGPDVTDHSDITGHTHGLDPDLGENDSAGSLFDSLPDL